MWDCLWTGAYIATMAQDAAPYGGVVDGAVATKNGRIVYAGPAAALPDTPSALAHKVIDLNGGLVTPGLIDCHTHLVYAGNRAAEFEARLLGATYEEIARSGGGIMSTVRATREASEDALVAAALPRLDALIAEGVCAVEIKSGYGLDLDNELKMLRVARSLERLRPVRIVTTLLAAHALPPEFSGRPDAYIGYICDEIMPAAAESGLADAVDGFCENIGFSPTQIERVFEKARDLGLPVKLHAEQLSDQGGAALAANAGALSADHLEYVSDAGIAAMAAAGTVAVLLPGAFYYLRETRLPPIQKLRDAKAAMAVATDCNPGTAPLSSILLAMNMACTLFRLTPEEALAGATREAARALGLSASLGTIEIGKLAHLAHWDVDHPASLAYAIGSNPLKTRIFEGVS